jgi:hypothetical protein
MLIQSASKRVITICILDSDVLTFDSILKPRCGASSYRVEKHLGDVPVPGRALAKRAEHILTAQNAAKTWL